MNYWKKKLFTSVLIADDSKRVKKKQTIEADSHRKKNLMKYSATVIYKTILAILFSEVTPLKRS